jgi:serine carboxypeptidase-like clade 2
VGGGFMSELGPFFPTRGGKLKPNAYAWNDVANMLWLDSPAFVGWSTSNVSSDMIVGEPPRLRAAPPVRHLLAATRRLAAG